MLPLISVIVAVRDGAATIDEQLEAMARQTIEDPWELIVVDNASRDGTVEQVRAWQERLPMMRLLHSPAAEHQPGALNVGVAAARAKLVAFCDADDVVADGWTAAMARALDSHAHVTGPLDLTRLNPPEMVWGEHVDRWLQGPMQHRFLPYAMGCNVGWQRDVILALGGFSTLLARSHDRDLSWRAQLSGHQLGFAPDALVHRRQRHSVSAAMRQTYASGRSEKRMMARYAGHGARNRSAWQLIRGWLELTARLPWLLGHRRRLRWVEMAGAQLGLTLPMSRRERDLVRQELESMLSAPRRK